MCYFAFETGFISSGWPPTQHIVKDYLKSLPVFLLPSQELGLQPQPPYPILCSIKSRFSHLLTKNSPNYSTAPNFFFFNFGARDWTQSLKHAKHTLYFWPTFQPKTRTMPLQVLSLFGFCCCCCCFP